MSHQRNNYLVSYGHSGNTWARYIVEFLTKKPTHGHRAFSISERGDNFLDIDLDAKPLLIKRHTLEDVTDKDYFILLLRDPSECIKGDQDVHKEFLKYYSLIKGYDAHKGPKSVMFYDELFNRMLVRAWIEDLKRTHNNQLLGGWMHSDRIEDLFDNWDKHLEQCKSLYANETHKRGADLSVIPKILLEHDLIKNTCSSVHV